MIATFVTQQKYAELLFMEIHEHLDTHKVKSDLINLNYDSFIKNSDIVFLDYDEFPEFPFSQFFFQYPDTNIFLITKNPKGLDVFNFLKLGIKGIVKRENELGEFAFGFKQFCKNGIFISPILLSTLSTYMCSGRSNKISQLPKRRADIAMQLLKGKTYREVAEMYFISLETVRDHVKKIYREFNIHSKEELREVCNYYG